MSTTDTTLEVRVEERDGRLLVLAPAIGWWSDQPAPGASLAPSSPVGTLETLNHRRTLLLPAGFTGRRLGFERVERTAAVEYGEILFELARVEAATSTLPPHAETAGKSSDLEAGMGAVRSPMDGVFYRRATPGQAAYVEVGDRVEAGQAVGLIEAMKTFVQVRYDGRGDLARAEVVAFLRDDGAEVRADEILLTVRPRL